MLVEEIVDEEGNDAEDEELELEPEAPPPSTVNDAIAVVDDDDDDDGGGGGGYITVDADIAAADAVDAVEAADVAEDEAWRATREACLVRDNGGLGLELELENMEPTTATPLLLELEEDEEEELELGDDAEDNLLSILETSKLYCKD